MLKLKNNLGFTLIELLVVLGIIAVISTLAVVYFDTARETSRDSRRLLDIKQIQLALKMFYNDAGYYPTAITPGQAIAYGGNSYLSSMPFNPKPRNDGDCLDQEYQYAQIDNGQRYTLNFCLGESLENLTPGNHTATANGVSNCPTGYVFVPGSATFNTTDFCAMKWEAKCAAATNPTVGLSEPTTHANTYDNGTQKCISDYSPVSVSSGLPIAFISQAEAITYCQSIGAHLMTNNEWMTIARNLENVSTNWSDGTVNSGYFNYGNSGNGQAMDGSSVYGHGGEDFRFRRTSYLSTGEAIWDFSGNVSEWLDNTCSSGDGYGYYYNTGGANFSWTDSNLDDYERAAAGPSNNSYGDDYNAGAYIGCSSNGYVFSRGGSASDSYRAGIYALDMNNDNANTGELKGFRCVK